MDEERELLLPALEIRLVPSGGRLVLLGWFLPPQIAL